MINIRMPLLEGGHYEATMIKTYIRIVNSTFGSCDQRVIEFVVNLPDGPVFVCFYGSKNKSQYKERSILENILGPVNFDIGSELDKMVGQKMEIHIRIDRDAKSNFWENVVNFWPLYE